MSLRSAKDHWKAGRGEAAIRDGWDAYEAAPDDPAAKFFLARLLREKPRLMTPDRIGPLLALLRDPGVEPAAFAVAGWQHLREHTALFAQDAASLAAALETDELALTLLSEAVVADYAVEARLTALRSWLSRHDSWTAFPRLAQALVAQTALNGGAWLIEADERAALAQSGGFVRAYLPAQADARHAPAYADAVTNAVAAQYEGWPYPQWRRITAVRSRPLAEDVRKMDPDGPDTIPPVADILIAGCGTGRQVAMAALRHPNDRIVAIDISAASLAYAAERCGAAGIAGIDFRRMDLHDVETLGRRFDAVFCTGVLHHLADPEAGWAALTRVLKPGGVMHIMVYSKLARLQIRALRARLGDLATRRIDDDLLREVRRRVLALPGMTPPKAADFYSLAGVHDLLLHRHEDPFDAPRIGRALASLDLRLIHFNIPRNDVRIKYRAEHPHDPLQRDFAAWSRLERGNPDLFATMYDIWCRAA